YTLFTIHIIQFQHSYVVLNTLRTPPRSTLFPTRRSSDLDQDRGEGSAVDGIGVPMDDPVDRGQVDNEQQRRGDRPDRDRPDHPRSEEHTSELQSRFDLVCRLLLEKTRKITYTTYKTCTDA